MPNEEWGIKRICPTTGKRFYDMNKKPIVSPYTGETVTLDANTRTSVASADKIDKIDKSAETDQAEKEEEVILDDASDDSTDDLAIDGDLLDDSDDNDDVPLDEIKDVPTNDDD